jgi:hypothetical protein
MIRGGCAAVLILLATVSTGCGPATDLAGPPSSGAEQVERYWLESVRTAKGITGRSVLPCRAGDCILLHYPTLGPEELKSLSDYHETSAVSAVHGGELYLDPDDPWCAAAAKEFVRDSFNCCTYAVGDVAGLTPGDWLEPAPIGETCYTVPMQVILDSYFCCLRVYPGPAFDWQAIEADPELQVGDVLCYVQTTKTGVQYVHAGRICRQDGRNLLVSKMGVGPLVRATIQATGQEFLNTFSEVRVYRKAI